MKYLLIICMIGFWTTADGLEWQQIAGRKSTGIPIYRAKAPADWIRQDHPASNDTMLPIVEFIIRDPEGTIRVTIHNFPSQSLEGRIPPAAQIARWQSQNPADEVTITPIAYGGYAGYRFESYGETSAVMGWALQLDPEHYRDLSWESDVRAEDRKSDYTIKAQGTAEAIRNHRKALLAFASSFELIDPIPRLP